MHCILLFQSTIWTLARNAILHGEETPGGLLFHLLNLESFIRSVVSCCKTCFNYLEVKQTVPSDQEPLETQSILL